MWDICVGPVIVFWPEPACMRSAPYGRNWTEHEVAALAEVFDFALSLIQTKHNRPNFEVPGCNPPRFVTWKLCHEPRGGETLGQFL